MTGISVVGLVLVAVGAMRGMQAEVLTEPLRCATFVVAAFALNIAFQVLGAAMFATTDRRTALTVGLVSGNRNVTLVWAAAAPFLAQNRGVELFIASAVFPIFMLPVATRCLLRLLDRGEPASKARISDVGAR